MTIWATLCGGSDLLLLPWVCSRAQLPALMIRVLIALAYEQRIAGSRCLVAIGQGLGTATPPEHYAIPGAPARIEAMMGPQVRSQAQPCCLEERFVLSVPGHSQPCPWPQSVCREGFPSPSPITGTVRCDCLLPPLDEGPSSPPAQHFPSCLSRSEPLPATWTPESSPGPPTWLPLSCSPLGSGQFPCPLSLPPLGLARVFIPRETFPSPLGLLVL